MDRYMGLRGKEPRFFNERFMARGQPESALLCCRRTMSFAMNRRSQLLAFLALAVGIVVASSRATDALLQKYPDVISAKVQPGGPETFDFDVTVSSPYDTPQRYADSIRVMDQDGTVYGERKLVHDHADEQPFTRDLYGVKVPRAIRVVVVQGHDQQFGYGGKTIDVTLPGR